MWETETLEINLLDSSGLGFSILVLISGLLATGLLFWGLFGKRYALLKKIVSMETLLFFLAGITFCSFSAIIQLRYLLEIGGKPYFITEESINFFSRCFLLGAVSLYKMVLFFLLTWKGRVR